MKKEIFLTKSFIESQLQFTFQILENLDFSIEGEKRDFWKFSKDFLELSIKKNNFQNEVLSEEALKIKNRKEEKQKEEKQFLKEWEEILKCYPKRGGSTNKALGFKAYIARRKEKVSFEFLLQKTKEYAEYTKKSKQENTTFVLMLSTFFGVGKRYDNEWVFNEYRNINNHSQSISNIKDVSKVSLVKETL